jgi:para-aminobenzoate synthetase component I
VLRSVAAATTRRSVPPPAALTGNWFGSRAVIAPSVAVDAVDVTDVFDVAAGGPGDHVGGGWFGYLSYPDAGRDGAGPRIPEAAGGWTDDVLRQDAGGNWWYESLSGTRAPTWLVDALTVDAPASSCFVGWRDADREAHRAGVLDCLDAIAAGEVYQACVCTQMVGTVTGSPVDFFADAVTRTAPAKAAFVAGAWGAVASLSPELFLRRLGETIVSSPIKGTLALDESPSMLRESAKDVAENVMIVDLVRNDLGRVAEVGTVTVPELCVLEEHPGLVHLVSTVRARLRTGAGWPELIEATFPAGSITGAPKSSALAILNELEPEPRGPYCGAIGWVDADAGRAALAVGIRTFWAEDDLLRFGTGAGITWHSDPRREWRETELKAARLLEVTSR